nr:translation machinery-associated protein [Paratrimastix eleionoma]
MTTFRRFKPEEDVSSMTQVRSSQQRKVRNSIISQYPLIEEHLEELLPKKQPLMIAKCHNHVSILVVNHKPLFFQIRDGPFIPVLRILHKYPFMMTQMRVDRGAIKFIINGANVMAKGLTNPGGELPNDIPAETPVAIMAEGKQTALGIGMTKLSSDEIRNAESGIAIELLHHLGDDLWKTPYLE